MSVINLYRWPHTGYLRFIKRGYSHYDVIHPLRGFLCKLLSMPEGFKVTRPSSACHQMEGTHHQTPAQFERKYLRSGK